MGDTFQNPQWMPESSDSTEPDFFFLFSQELSAFHLKDALYGFSLAYRNCHHHYSCALGSLLSKIRVT